MKTIIVPTDYSENASNAALYAAALARQTEASTLILYHAFFIPPPIADMPLDLPTQKELTTEHLVKLERIARDISNAYSIKVECFTSAVPVTDQLPELVKQWQADLVVLGMGRLSEFDRYVFGSTTVRVIREATFPVLVVPSEFTFQAPDRILFACNYEVLSLKNKLSLLKELATAFDAQVEILHIEQEEHATVGGGSGSAKVPNLEVLLHGVKHEYIFLIQENVLEGIQQSIQENQSNLLVMVPRHHGFWDIIFNQSTTRAIAFQTQIPLLVLPNPK